MSSNINTNEYTPSIEQAKEYIYAIDFSMIIEKMVKQDRWSENAALMACQLYRNYLFLNKKYPANGLLPPSLDIDEFWHYHILDTKKYVTDCQAIFGFYVHHYPYLILDHQLTSDGLNRAFELTQDLHIKEFGEPIYEARSILGIFWQKVRNLF